MRTIISNWLNKQNHVVLSFIIFVSLVLISWLVRDSRPLACDMAEYLNNPLRILNGEIPYRDFWLLFPPGEVYFPALVYKLLGLNTDILRNVTILSSCLIPVAGFYLGRVMFGDNFKAIVVALLLYFNSVVSNYEGPDYLHLYLLFIIFATIFLIRHFKEGENYFYVFFGGIMMGMAFLFKLYEVGGVFSAFLLLLGVYPILSKQGRKNSLIGPTLFLGGSSLIGIILVLSMGDLTWLMINELVFESVKNGTSMNLPYFNDVAYVFASVTADIESISAGGGAVSFLYLGYHLLRLVVVTGYYIIPFLAIITYLFFIYKKANYQTLLIGSVLFLWGLMSFPKALGRSDIAHLAPSVAPFLIFIFYAGVNFLRNNKLKILSYSIVSIMLLSISFPVFKYISLAVKPQYYVETSSGNVPFDNIKDRNDLQNTLHFISENTNRSDFIFVTPWDAAPIYALTGLRNPTYFDSLNDLIIRQNIEKQKNIINDLLSHKTKYIIHNADWGYDGKKEQQFRSACSVLQSFIETQCLQVAEFGFYSIYLIIDINN